MSKIQNPVIGRAKGSAGGMTFAKQFDKNTMRAKPFEVANPKTQGQTTQRDFFKQVQEIVASVSPEQLRSLFGDMPKGMSRRNALSKQVAEAYKIDGTTKSVDFSKLQAIGNGEKVTTPLCQIDGGNFSDAPSVTVSMFGAYATTDTNVIAVLFDADSNRIVIANLEDTLALVDSYADVTPSALGVQNGYGYLTCEEKGGNVYLRGFGSFIIKTRAEKTGRNIGKTVPIRGDVVSFRRNGGGNEAIVNFANYDFNNLTPGGIYAEPYNEGTEYVGDGEFQHDGDNVWIGEAQVVPENGAVVYLAINQNGEFVESVPFTAVNNT